VAQNQQNQNNLLGLALLLSKGGLSTSTNFNGTSPTFNLGTGGFNSTGGWSVDSNGNLIGLT
jgi:hypothetical protein